MEELSSLNVKSRYQAFENATTNENGNLEKSPISVKRSPSILSKLAKYAYLAVILLVFFVLLSLLTVVHLFIFDFVTQ